MEIMEYFFKDLKYGNITAEILSHLNSQKILLLKSLKSLTMFIIKILRKASLL